MGVPAILPIFFCCTALSHSAPPLRKAAIRHQAILALHPYNIGTKEEIWIMYFDENWKLLYYYLT